MFDNTDMQGEHTLTIISSNILSVILVLFIIVMTKRNMMLKKYDTKYFVLAGIVNIIMLILEITDFYLSSINFPSVLFYRNMINALGFAISPFILCFLILFNFNKKNNNIFYWSIPLWFNIFVCLCSIKTGWIFHLYPPNHYLRGDFFAIPFIVNFFYMVLLVVIIIKNNKDYAKEEIVFLIAILVTTIICFALQIVITGLFLIWSSAAIGILLYYMFLREMQFGYDIMTSVRNRTTFEKDIVKSQKFNIVGIVIVDINDLKEINDQKGHKMGDGVIINSAKILQESFIKIGGCYRIGGDEFCVICNDCSEKQIANALHNLESLLSERNKDSSIKTMIAYGYAFFYKYDGKSIFEAFNQADAAMYRHKDALKGKLM